MNKYRVMIVDDNDEILNSLKKYLEQENYIIEANCSALDAFEKIKTDKYHIVLIDIDLPDMNGIELLKEIKRYDALTQVIMMSSNSTMDQILGSLEYGANDFIQKPFENMEHVTKIIEYSVQKLERWRKSIIKLIR